jgi:hypothetical protein
MSAATLAAIVPSVGMLLRGWSPKSGGKMNDFIPPNFVKGCLELRVTEGEVCLLATKKGLEWLAAKCVRLAGKKLLPGDTDHIHIDDYQILTHESLPAVLVRFET